MRLSLVVLCLALFGCSTSAANPDTPATAVPVVRVEQEPPVTVEGQSGGNTRPFTLLGGHYTARWSARSLTGGMCFHGLSLRPVVPNQRFVTATLGTATIPGGSPQSGETQVYNVPPGEYYVNSVSACGWSVTLSPLR